MSESHFAYLSIGSNIQPEFHLVQAIKLLHNYGEVLKISSAWESESVGTEAPNYLNACVLFKCPLVPVELKENIIRPIEAQLGRKRGDDKFASRTIDIDIVLFDEQPYNVDYWEYAFVIVPLAEIHPEYQNPTTKENVTETATRLRRDVWVEARRDVLSQFNGVS